ncbi:hypothetical protein [Sulfuracidifex tepidarius]|nr:hypothetical protein [Sulfuracidifex tepidarius]
MREYLVKKYEENIISIMESTLSLLGGNEEEAPEVLDNVNEIGEDIKLYNSIIEHNTTIGQYRDIIIRGLEKLIESLSKNEDKFWKEVMNSSSLNFQITIYYSLYLKFLTKAYLRLTELKVDPNMKTAECPKKRILGAVNSLVGILGTPLIMYVKENRIYPYISDLTGILLYVTKDEVLPSGNSLGYYLFSRIHGTENE